MSSEGKSVDYIISNECHTILSAHIIAITGASGSGKSHFTDKLYASLSDWAKVAVIREDSYYRDQSHIPLAQRHAINYDHPESLEHELLVEHLQQLKQGKSIGVPNYDYEVHNRATKITQIEPNQLIIVEGILLLSNPKLRELFDITLFVDTPLEVCFNRRLARDVAHRGRTVESVQNQFENTVKPMFFKFIAPNKKYAELVLSGELDVNLMLAKTQQQFMAMAETYRKNEAAL